MIVRVEGESIHGLKSEDDIPYNLHSCEQLFQVTKLIILNIGQ